MGHIDYKVIGIDEDRPPAIQTRPCIDLFFQLNEAAPPGWCDEFQARVGKQPFSIKIDPEIGLHVETWCRTPDQIAKVLETVKSVVALTNDSYAQRLKAESKVVDTSDETVVISAEQLALNKLIEKLVFDD